MEIIRKVKDGFEELRLYWNQPRPGEYVPYKEVVSLSVAWMALLMSIQWTIGFGVGNWFTGMTLKMDRGDTGYPNYALNRSIFRLTASSSLQGDSLAASSSLLIKKYPRFKVEDFISFQSW